MHLTFSVSACVIESMTLSVGSSGPLVLNIDGSSYRFRKNISSKPNYLASTYSCYQPKTYLSLPKAPSTNKVHT